MDNNKMTALNEMELENVNGGFALAALIIGGIITLASVGFEAAALACSN